MYDHGLGHIVPRDAENVSLLGTVLGNLVPKVEEQIRREAHLSKRERKELRREGKMGGKLSAAQAHGHGVGQAQEQGQGGDGEGGGGLLRPGMHQRGNSHLSNTSAQDGAGGGGGGGGSSSDPTTSGSITPVEVDFTVGKSLFLLSDTCMPLLCDNPFHLCSRVRRCPVSNDGREYVCGMLLTVLAMLRRTDV